jgi:predicted dehydrogenase
MTTDSILNTAVIGCGGHARHHFGMIADEPRLRLVAAADIDADRLEQVKEQHHPDRVFTDYREMLEHCDLDLVYVVTMPGHLLAIVLDCMARHLHVSVEKSPGMTSAQTEQMATAGRESRGKSMVSFNRRYFPEVLAVRRLVQERGGAVHCSGTYNKTLSLIGTPAMAGIAPDPVICDAIHHVDLIRWLAGPTPERAARPVEVYSEVADGARAGSHRHSAVIRFDTGAIGTLMSHYGVGYRIQRAEVHAEDFSAYLDLTREPVCELYSAVAAGSGTSGAVLDGSLNLDEVGGAGFNETIHFANCIFEDAQPWSTLDDAVVTMRLCEAIRSGHKGSL